MNLIRDNVRVIPGLYQVRFRPPLIIESPWKDRLLWGVIVLIGIASGWLWYRVVQWMIGLMN